MCLLPGLEQLLIVCYGAKSAYAAELMAHSFNDYSKIRVFCLEFVFFAIDKGTPLSHEVEDGLKG